MDLSVDEERKIKLNFWNSFYSNKQSKAWKHELLTITCKLTKNYHCKIKAIKISQWQASSNLYSHIIFHTT